MATDYGLSAMTGIIPVTVMAGVNVAVLKELFPQQYGGSRKRRKSRKSRRSSSGSNFNNVGF